MASQLKVDTITGVTTAGSIAVTGEGNSTTTNLQQGLCKAWGNYDYDGTQAFADSFNFASITDRATGKGTLAYTNNMSNANYAILTNNVIDEGSYAGTNHVEHDSAATTSTVGTAGMHDVSSFTDIELAGVDIKGDLA